MRRREFIRAGSYGVVGLAALGGLTTDWYGAYAPILRDPGTDGDRVVPTFCELCFWKCGVLAHVKDGRVTKIQGNPRDPLSRGRICPRGAGGTGLLYDPDRLKRPMVRVGGRGGDRFQEVSWDAALDEVAEGFERIRRRHGAEALALYTHGYGGGWFKHLFGAYGCPNVTAPSFDQCRGPREVGFNLTFGLEVGSPENTDIENARCLTLLGSHLGENMHNTQVQEFAAALRSGADLIVVDPRQSVAASKARYWLPIRPGTDLALLLAWMHVIIGEGLYDRDYVERYAIGFDQLRAHVASCSPEWAYPRCGIEPDRIRTTARVMAAARPASLVHPGRRVTWYGDDTQRSRAIAMLNALLGSWGRRGGFYMPSQMAVPETDVGGHPATNGAHDRPSRSHYPLADAVLSKGVCDASIPGQVREDAAIRGWMVYGTNLPITLPDPRETRAALQALDLVVTIDVLPAEIVGWSDVVLPEATYLERDDDLNNPWYREPYIGLRQAAVPPMYDTRPGWWIARELAHRLGLGEHFAWSDAREYVDGRLEAAGIDVAQARRDGVVLGERAALLRGGRAAGVLHAVGPDRAVLAPAGRAGVRPHADLARRRAGGAAAGVLPPPLRPGAHPHLRADHEQPAAERDPRRERGLGEPPGRRPLGARGRGPVHLENQDGVRSTFTAPVKVTERIRPDAVYLVHGYGRTARKGLTFAHGRGIDDAELITRYRTDPIMGGTG
jgi:thiosulfate reductase / polysulfide reductase chain A